MLINQEKELVLLEDLGLIKPTEKSNYKKRFGLYKCFCGKEFKAISQNVEKGNTTSCGCYHLKIAKEVNTTHGLGGHILYHTWVNMIQRCNNVNHNKYEYYGGRGIAVCERWLKLENFIDDMFPTFQDGLTLDRIDEKGHYEPDNCRWANRCIQSRNTRLIYKHNTSGYRGVSYKKQNNKFRAQIKVNSKTIPLGYFDNAIDGAIAYNKYVIENNLEHTLNLV